MIEPMATDGLNDMFPACNWSMTWLNEHCMKRFNVNATKRSDFMIKNYGLKNILKTGITKIIFSNGNNDPWKVGGFMKTYEKYDIISIVIPNGAHHSDMYASNPNYDTTDVINARKQEMSILKVWINDVLNQSKIENTKQILK